MNLRPFFIGNPPDGCASTGVDIVKVFEVPSAIGGGIASVPSGKKWLVQQVVLVNMTNIPGYWSAMFSTISAQTTQVDPSLLAIPAGETMLRSVAGGPGASPQGSYFAWSEPVPPRTRLVLPILAFGLGGQKLMVGAYPGANAYLGAGGISMQILGAEMRD